MFNEWKIKWNGRKISAHRKIFSRTKYSKSSRWNIFDWDEHHGDCIHSVLSASSRALIKSGKSALNDLIRPEAARDNNSIVMEEFSSALFAITKQFNFPQRLIYNFEFKNRLKIASCWSSSPPPLSLSAVNLINSRSVLSLAWNIHRRKLFSFAQKGFPPKLANWRKMFMKTSTAWSSIPSTSAWKKV